MALPITNLSLNAIHVEVGGSTTTTCTLNDSDIRGIANTDPTYDGGDGINQTSGTTVSIGEFRNASNTASPTVSLPAAFTHSTTRTSTCYANLRVGSDGDLYTNTLPGADNFNNNRGTWLTSGSASDCWLDWSTTGSVDVQPTGPRFQLSSNGDFKAVDFDQNPGWDQGTVTVSIYDAQTGGTLLDSETYTLRPDYNIE